MAEWQRNTRQRKAVSLPSLTCPKLGVERAERPGLGHRRAEVVRRREVLRTTGPADAPSLEAEVCHALGKEGTRDSLLVKRRHVGGVGRVDRLLVAVTHLKRPTICHRWPRIRKEGAAIGTDKSEGGGGGPTVNSHNVKLALKARPAVSFWLSSASTPAEDIPSAQGNRALPHIARPPVYTSEFITGCGSTARKGSISRARKAVFQRRKAVFQEQERQCFKSIF